MKKLLLAITIVSWINSTLSFAAPCDQIDARVSNRIIVRIADGQTFDSFVNTFQIVFPKVNVIQLEQIPNRPIFLASIDAQPAILDVIEAEIEAGFGGVLAWGEFVYLDEGPEGSTGSIFVDRPVNVVSFQSQYSTNLVGIDVSHAMSTGNGVVVAVLDTGIVDTHPAVIGRIAAGGFDFVDNDADPSEAQDLIDNDNDTLFDEGWGHGTFVSSIVLLAAPDAKILPIRVLDSDCGGTSWMLARGMFHAIDQGVEVMNISIGSTYHSNATSDAVDESKDLGIVIVAAAGNCGREDPRTFPAMQSNVIGVVATDTADVLAGFSNYSSLVAIAAPGFSANFDVEPIEGKSIIGALPNGGYGYWQGTSMSAPLVSGATALMRSQHPEYVSNAMTWDAITTALLNTSQNIDVENPQFVGLVGAGRINIGALVALGPVAPPLGDLDGNGVLTVTDIIQVISSWGLVHSSADLNGDGTVGVQDLLIIVGNWQQ